MFEKLAVDEMNNKGLTPSAFFSTAGFFSTVGRT